MLKLSEVMAELCGSSPVKSCPSRRAEPVLTIAFSESVGFGDVASKVDDRNSHQRTKHVHTGFHVIVRWRTRKDRQTAIKKYSIDLTVNKIRRSLL